MHKSFVLQKLQILSCETMTFSPGDLCIEKGVFTHHFTTQPNVVNKEGYWAVPGFTDSHVHLAAFALAKSRLKLDGLNLADIQSRVADVAGKTKAGSWIHGRGWEAACRLEGGFPCAAELDLVTDRHPVALFSKDGHSLWINSLAMDRLKLSSDVFDPFGGVFERDSHGKLTGLMKETAADFVRALLPDIADHEKESLIRLAITELHRQGITSVHSFGGLKEYRFLQEMAAREPLGLNVTCYLDYQDIAEAVELGLKRGDGTDNVRLAGVKLYADGALGSRTAAVTSSYDGESHNFGIEVMSPEEMKETARLAATQGWSIAIHAIGDKAVQNSLFALIEARKQAPNLPGLRVEHVQLVRPEDVQLFNEYNITASIQPCHLISDIPMIDRFWSQQPSMLYPYGTLDRSGANVVLGSDAPIDDENVLRNIRYATLRKSVQCPASDPGWHPAEAMCLQGAFQAVTCRPVKLEAGKNRGDIRVGMAADFILFKENPFARDLETFHELEICEVYQNGHRLI